MSGSRAIFPNRIGSFFLFHRLKEARCCHFTRLLQNPENGQINGLTRRPINILRTSCYVKVFADQPSRFRWRQNSFYFALWAIQVEEIDDWIQCRASTLQGTIDVMLSSVMWQFSFMYIQEIIIFSWKGYE